MGLIIKNASNIVTCTDSILDGIIENGYIIIKDGLIKSIGTGVIPDCLCDSSSVIIDAKGKTITPGLVDCHTHLIHGGSRENELPMKLSGVPYIEILKSGGGILSTVRATRKFSKEQLKDKALKSLNQMLIHGTTTVEAKSGYGLDFETEIKCLEAAKELNIEHPVDIVSTYMGAHAIPPEYKNNSSGYIELMFKDVMPYIKENGLAEFVDVFCEDGVFSVTESEQIMQEAKNLGFRLKIHADEIVPLGGGELAARMGAISAEHLLAVSEQGIHDMADANVTAVLLPGTSFYLMTGKFAPARKMIEKGVRVAISTDYNPGTCPTENLQVIMTFACFGMKMTPLEIIKGMTINAAYAIGRGNEIGSIEIGKKADLVVFDSPNLNYIIYHFGINHVDKVVKGGEIVVDKGILKKTITIHQKLQRREEI